MRKMISVLLAGVLAVNLGACSSAASKASKEAESAAPAGTTAQESGGKRTLRIAGESWQVTKLFLNEAAEAFMKDIRMLRLRYRPMRILRLCPITVLTGKKEIPLAIWWL